MAGLKYADDVLSTDNSFMDILIYNLKVLAFSSIIKDERTADQYETLDTLKEAELYIACIEKHAELYHFDSISDSVLKSISGLNLPFNPKVDPKTKEYESGYLVVLNSDQAVDLNTNEVLDTLYESKVVFTINSITSNNIALLSMENTSRVYNVDVEYLDLYETMGTRYETIRDAYNRHLNLLKFKSNILSTKDVDNYVIHFGLANTEEEFKRYEELYIGRTVQQMIDIAPSKEEERYWLYASTIINSEYYDEIVYLMRNYYVETYEEKNEYYRTITGLPPKGDPGIPIRYYADLIPDYVDIDLDDRERQYVHELGLDVNKTLEALGVLDVIRADFPEYDYLNYLTQGVDIYTARTKEDFQILWNTSEMDPVLTEEFLDTYEKNRLYVQAAVYTKAMEVESKYYHSFMLVYTLLITLIDMICNIQSHMVKKDVLDARCINYIFSMYGVPYFRLIPYKYQEKLCKNIHRIIKKKSCDEGLLELVNLFGFENLDIWKLYILKDQSVNMNEAIEFDTERVLYCNYNDHIQHFSITEELSSDSAYAPLPNDYEYTYKYLNNVAYDEDQMESTDRYITYPFPYYLEKGNILFVSIDGRLLTSGTDYVIYNYNRIQFKIDLTGSTLVTYDFYYDDSYSGEQLITIPDNQTYIYRTKEYSNVATNIYSFYLGDADFAPYLAIEGNQIFVVLNGVWLRPDQYTVDHKTEVITITDQSIPLDKIKDDIEFIFIRSNLFDVEYKIYTDTLASNATISIEEPFTNYIKEGNEYLVAVDSNLLCANQYKISTDYTTLKLLDTDTYSADSQVCMYYLYSNKSVSSNIEVIDHSVFVESTEPYQIDFCTDFPVDHYVESGYKVYIRLYNRWIPSDSFNILGKNTIALSNKKIISQSTGHKMEIRFIYMPYDRTIYKDLQVKYTSQTATLDYQSKFEIQFPFKNFLEQGNKVIVDVEGVYLEANDSQSGYTVMESTDTSMKIYIANRDLRPLKGQKVNYTFYYKDDEEKYRLGVEHKSLGVLESDSQIFEIPYPCYPYSQIDSVTNKQQSFIVQVGDVLIPEDNIEFTDEFHFRFTALDPSLYLKKLKDQPISIIFLYNKWYLHNNKVSPLIVETKQQQLLDQPLDIETPAELYIENRWPYFITDTDTNIISSGSYEVFNHTLYADYDEIPVTTMLQFYYIYRIEIGYIEEQYSYKSATSTTINSTNVYFSRISIREQNPVAHLKDKSSWRSYDSITLNDQWWDGRDYIQGAHEVIKNNIYLKKFNYERTKYYQIAAISDLADYATQSNYLYSMLYNSEMGMSQQTFADSITYKLGDAVTINIPTLSPSYRFKLSHIFIYMTVLNYLYNGFEDLIIEHPSANLWLKGFNFSADLNKLKTYIKGQRKYLSDFPIWNFITDTSDITDLVKFVNMYKENNAVRQTIIHKLVEAQDYEEYRIWKMLYDSLLLYKMNTLYFQKKDGTMATSYTDYLKDQCFLLYESIMNLRQITDITTLRNYIVDITDSIIYILQEYMYGTDMSSIFKASASEDLNNISKYLHILVDFFKSYKITLIYKSNSDMISTDPYDIDNYMRPIDNINKITETANYGDSIQIEEEVITKETMRLHEWVEIDSQRKQLIEYPYQNYNVGYMVEDDGTGNTRAVATKDIESDTKVLPVEYSISPIFTTITDAGKWMHENISISKVLKDQIEAMFDCELTIEEIHASSEDTDTTSVSDGIMLLTGDCVIETDYIDPQDIDGDCAIEIEYLDPQDVDGECIISETTLTSVIINGRVNLYQEGNLKEGTGIIEIYGGSKENPLVPLDGNITRDIDGVNENILLAIDTQGNLVEYFAGSNVRFIPESLKIADENKFFLTDNFTSFAKDCKNLVYAVFDAGYCNNDGNTKVFDSMFEGCTTLSKVDGLFIEQPNIDAIYYDPLAGYVKYLYSDTTLGFVFYPEADSDTAPYESAASTSAGDLSLDSIFADCTALIKGLDYVYTPQNLSMKKAFYNCKNLQATPVIRSRYGNMRLDNAFEGCSALTYLPQIVFATIDPTKKLDDADLIPTINLTETFKNCSRMRPITEEGKGFYFNGAAVFMNNTFEGCDLFSRGVSILAEGQTSIIMDHTYKDCKILHRSGEVYIDNLSELYMNSTFADLTSLQALDTVYLKGLAHAYLNNTFENCVNLIDINRLLDSTDGYYHLSETFKGCTSLTTATVNMDRVDEISNIFIGCTALESVTFINVSDKKKYWLTHENLDGDTLSYEIIIE